MDRNCTVATAAAAAGKSRFARASWIEINHIISFCFLLSCRGSREPRGSKWYTAARFPIAECVEVRESLVDRNRLQSPVSMGSIVEVRESLVDRNQRRLFGSASRGLSRFARASWIEILLDLDLVLLSVVEVRESLVDRNTATLQKANIATGRGLREPRGSKFIRLTIGPE